MKIDKSLVFLLGLGYSGKTETLKAFFGPNRSRGLWVKIVNGVPVFCVNDSSLQEELGKKESDRLGRTESIKRMIDDMKARIKKCEDYCKEKKYGRFILILPATVRARERNVSNDALITAPITWARQRYDTSVVYLQKLTKGVESLAEKLESRATIRGIEDYERQCGNLEEFIKLIVV